MSIINTALIGKVKKNLKRTNIGAGLNSVGDYIAPNYYNIGQTYNTNLELLTALEITSYNEIKSVTIAGSEIYSTLMQNGTGYFQIIDDVNSISIIIDIINFYSSGSDTVIQYKWITGGQYISAGAFCSLKEVDWKLAKYILIATSLWDADFILDSKLHDLSTNVLQLDNVVSFSPSLDYHPATKKYVDDAVLGLSADTNDYVDSVNFDTGTGTLTIGRTGTLSDLTINLDGRYQNAGSYVTTYSEQALAPNVALELNGSNLTLTKADGNYDLVDLSTFLDDTDTTYTINTNLYNNDIRIALDGSDNNTTYGLIKAGENITFGTPSPGEVSIIGTNNFVTNVSIDAITNILKLERAGLSDLTVDLSQFIDEDARAIATGNLDSNTGIVTFTRDDSTQFTVDLSGLLDNTNWSRIESGSYNSGTITLTRGDSSTVNIDVSDLQETTTTLSLIGNQLQYVDETGTQTNIDLSQYVSTDTNDYVDSAILSGTTLTIGRTGILTDLTVDLASLNTDTYINGASVTGSTLRLERNDSTNIDVDLSSFLDDTNLVTSVNGQTGDVVIPAGSDTYVTSGAVSGNDLVLTLNDSSQVTIDVTDLVGGSTSGNSYILNGRETQDFTATSGQTEFFVTIGLEDIEVFFNGIKLDEEDYSIETDSIKLSVGAAAGDNIEIINYGNTFGTNNAYNKYAYTIGTASDNYTGSLTNFPGIYLDGLVEVYYNGLKLAESEYDATSGTSIVLLENGISGDYLEIIAFVPMSVGNFYTKTEIDTMIAGAGIGATETSGTTSQVIDSWSTVDYRSGEYLLTVTGASGYMTLKMIVMYDDISALNTQYAQIGTDLGSFTTIMNGDNLEVIFTPIDQTAVVQYSKTLIETIVASGATTTLPTDLGTLNGVVDLLAGDGIIDLNAGEISGDLNSGSGTIDLNDGSGITDLNI